jgi:protein-tyrosine phosphatase
VCDYFDGLVLCAYEYQPGCFPDVSTIWAPIRDDGSPMTREEQIEAVKAAGKVIRLIKEGMRVLVTCYAGLNRSGLVCTIVLCKGPSQMDVDDAIELIKEARGSYALSNSDFVDFLRAFCSR